MTAGPIELFRHSHRFFIRDVDVRDWRFRSERGRLQRAYAYVAAISQIVIDEHQNVRAEFMVISSGAIDVPVLIGLHQTIERLIDPQSILGQGVWMDDGLEHQDAGLRPGRAIMLSDGTSHGNFGGIAKIPVGEYEIFTHGCHCGSDCILRIHRRSGTDNCHYGCCEEYDGNDIDPMLCIISLAMIDFVTISARGGKSAFSEDRVDSPLSPIWGDIHVQPEECPQERQGVLKRIAGRQDGFRHQEVREGGRPVRLRQGIRVRDERQAPPG